MENKLQELTQKLYNEGLSKGRQEADALVADAQAKAKKIIDDAKNEADQIKKQAENSAKDLQRNTLAELNLAGKQAMEKLKLSIQEMIVAKIGKDSVAKANLDPEFVKEVLIAVAKNWKGASSDKVRLEAMLPKDKETEMGKKIEAGVKADLNGELDIVYTNGVKSGFRIGPKRGGYHINFTDAGFNALLNEYLRPKVSEILYGKKE